MKPALKRQLSGTTKVWWLSITESGRSSCRSGQHCALLLLAAERGTGKTTLVNRLLEAIQEGLDFLGGFKTTKGRCLLIQGDEPKEHAQAVYTQQDLKLNWDVIYPEDQFPVELLLKAVETKQYDAICIDSLTTVLCSEDRRTTDPVLVDFLYKLNRAAVDNGCLLYTSPSPRDS